MSDSYLIFQGDAQICLQGHDALVPLSLQGKRFTSAIGTENSELVITEYRKETIRAVKDAMNTGNLVNFSDIFNQCAHVEIRFTPDTKGLDINLYEASKVLNVPILWMGVLENNLMPAYEVEWEVLKAVDESTTAFCALIPVTE